MRKTALFFALTFASIAAAAVAFALRPHKAAPQDPLPVAQAQAGALRIGAQLDHRYLSARGGDAYLQVDLQAQGDASGRHRVPVNAVLILDRSGSMQGEKIERAIDAARTLIDALNGEDRLAIVEFGSDASVLLPGTAMTAEAKRAVLEKIARLEAGGGTNMSSAFDLAAPQLEAGRARDRIDKVFLASDGQANEGISERGPLLALAQRDFGQATLSTFGLGEDYDEDFMNALAAKSGGRARYIASAEVLPAAFREELSRASSLVAREVRVRVQGAQGASVERMLGYQADADGWVRLPDFAAGEERQVLAKVALPHGIGEREIAAVEVAFVDAQGEPRTAKAEARAQLTEETALLAEPAGPALKAGAKVELAEIAERAAAYREQGQADEADKELRSMNAVAAAAPSVASEADSYAKDVGAIDRGSGAAAKKLKMRTFDAVRAPLAGW